MDPITLGLPHRKPFLFLDTVTALIPGESATARVCFDPGDPVFNGHFPGRPVVPGVLLTEALAQLAGIAGAEVGREFLLSAIRSMKFPTAARPGDVIELSVHRAGRIGALVQFDAEATVAGVVVAAGSLVLNETGENPASRAEERAC